MRSATLLSLLIPAACGAGLGLALVGCHRDHKPPGAAQAGASAARGLKVERYDAPIPRAPLQGGKLETLTPRPQAAPAPAPVTAAVSSAPPAAAPVPADKPQARAAPVAPLAQARAYARPYGYGDRYGYGPIRTAEPRPDPRYADPAPRYDAYSRVPDLSDDQDQSAGPGFRITLPICRQAARAGDPLARSEACQDMLQTARDQLRLCRQAFEDGDDRVAMSPACRQSARGR